MNAVIAIGIGGGLGSLARHFLSRAVQAAAGSAFPWGILTVNVVGGLLMGVIVGVGAQKLSLTPELRAFLTTGVLGGFTTFSAFSLDAALLMQRGDWSGAALYVIGSVVLSVGALFTGLWLARVLL